jgi:hypothetical protein
MPTPPILLDGDIVVREERRDGAPLFVFRQMPGPDQYLTGSRDEAFSQALRFGRRLHVQVWLAEEHDLVRLDDFRDGVTSMMASIMSRLRSEFAEMPGLRLTAAQAQRFCGVHPRLCRASLDALVDDNFLCRLPDSTYGRRSELSARRPAAKGVPKDLAS